MSEATVRRRFNKRKRQVYMQNKQKHRIAIVGCGGMGRQHARSLAGLEDFEFVAGVDRFPQPLEELRKITDTINFYSDVDEMLEKERPDIVTVSTAVKDHAEPTIKALRAGAHVLCEKPFARTLAQADEMIECARQAGRMLLVNNEYNVYPRTLAPLKHVREGGIGEIVALRGTFKGNFCGGWDLAEGAPHLFALAIQFAGTPQWVSGTIGTGDHFATESEIFDGSVIPSINAGWLVGDRIHATVGFERGIAMQCEFLGIKTNPHLLVIGTEGAVIVPYGAGGALPYRTSNPNDPTATWEPLAFDWAGAENRQVAFAYEHWAQWLADQPAEVHPMAGIYGRQALEVVHGVFESHFQNGARVSIPLAHRDHPLERRVPRDKK